MNLCRALRALVAEPEPCVQVPQPVDLFTAYLPAGVRAHHALAAAVAALIALTCLSVIIIMLKSRTIAALQREVHSLKTTIAKAGSAASRSTASSTQPLQKAEQVEKPNAIEHVIAPSFTVSTPAQTAAKPKHSSKQLHNVESAAILSVVAVDSEVVADVTAAETASSSIALATSPKAVPAAHVPAAHTAAGVREDLLQACEQSDVTAAPTVLIAATTTTAPTVAAAAGSKSSSKSSNAAPAHSAPISADSVPSADAAAPVAEAPAPAAASAVAPAAAAAEPSSRVLQQRKTSLASEQDPAVVLVAMRAEPANSTVQCQGCYALHALLSNRKVSAARLKAAGARQVVLAVSTLFPGQRNEWGVTALLKKLSS
jgi:hypothetical protein